MKILCIGDSNTYGFDPRSYLDDRYPESVRWTDQIERRSAGSTVGKSNGKSNGDAESSAARSSDTVSSVINFGINGMTIPRDHSVFTELIARKDPDLVIVMLGTNDLLEGASAIETAGRMESFIASLRTMKKPILLIAPPYLQIGEWVPDEETVQESKKLGDLYREVAERNACRFADSGKWGIDLAFDGVHFSAAGHDTFAKELGKII